jgi:aminoglycoside 6'-N-acetyltransferase I
MNGPDIQIIDLHSDDEEAISHVADLLVKSFREHSPNAWPDIDTASREVMQSFGAGRISRIATNESGAILGWIGGISKYRGKTWELHPLVVHLDYQGRGIGRELVNDLEERVKEQGGITVWIGTDDEDNMTSVSGIDLYPNVLEHLAHIKNIKGHPYEFYQKMGYSIVGILPDANGPGQPDIFMAKRVDGIKTEK